MPDVVETAQKYSHRLRSELAKLDEFLSYAERLVKEQGHEAPPAHPAGIVEGTTEQAPAGDTPPSGTNQTGNAHGGATSGNGRAAFFQNGAARTELTGEKASG